MTEVPVVHRDAHLAIVDKPRGTLVVPAPGRTGATLVDLLARQFGQRVLAVHRLDEDTTGALIVAFDESTLAALTELFRRHQVERHYLALLSAAPSPPAGRIAANLDESGDLVRVVPRGGRTAVTHYETVARRGRCTLVRCRLETGRRNQIRVHFAALGCPLAGDRKYGYRQRPGERFPRVMLHSHRIRFVHPVTSSHLDFEVPPPEAELRVES